MMFTRTIAFWVAATIVVVWVASCPPLRAEDKADREKIQPNVVSFLRDHCVVCHAEGSKKGGFSLEPLLDPKGAILDGERFRAYEKVFHQVAKKKMPPVPHDEVPSEERQRMVDAMEKQLWRFVDSEGHRDAKPFRRRLNRHEFENTLCDVLGLPRGTHGFRRFHHFLPEETAIDGFETVGGGLSLSKLHLELYLQLAERYLTLAMDWGRPTHRWRIDYAAPGTAAARKIEADLRLGDRFRADAHAIPGVYFINLGKPDSAGSFANDFQAERMRPNVFTGNRRLGFPLLTEHGALVWDEFHFGDFFVRQPGLYRYRIRCRPIVKPAGLAHPVLMQVSVGDPRDPPADAIAMNVELTPNEWATHELTLFRELEEVRVGENSLMRLDFRFRTTFPVKGPLPNTAKNVEPNLQAALDFYHHLVEIDFIEVEGPLPPVQDATLRVPGVLSKDRDETAVVRTALERMLPRAFRRSVSPETVERYLKRFQDERKRGAPFGEAMRATLMAAFVSPDFLFVVNDRVATKANQPLSAHGLASRLSYFLWSSCPDDELLRAAESGALLRPEELRKQVQRMIRDRRSYALAENFASQWLHLKRISAAEPDPELYHYNKQLERAMVLETIEFFNEVLRQDLSILNFLDSDWTMLNETLAAHYKIAGVRGDHFRRVALEPKHHRGGVLGHASILKITSNSTRTSPVVRGAFILENILGDPPPPPPDNAGELANKVPGLDEVTQRRQLEIHRDVKSCARCHSKIDPIGFALENYNAVGLWREREADGLKKPFNSPKIDARATLPDGREINGPDQLRRALIESPDPFVQCFIEKMMVYSLGRSLRFQDRRTIARLRDRLKENQFRLGALIEELILSEEFRNY